MILCLSSLALLRDGLTCNLSGGLSNFNRLRLSLDLPQGWAPVMANRGGSPQLCSPFSICSHLFLFYVAIAPFVSRNPKTLVLNSVASYLLISLLPNSPSQNKEKQIQKQQKGLGHLVGPLHPGMRLAGCVQFSLSCSWNRLWEWVLGVPTWTSWTQPEEGSQSSQPSGSPVWLNWGPGCGKLRRTSQVYIPLPMQTAERLCLIPSAEVSRKRGNILRAKMCAFS